MEYFWRIKLTQWKNEKNENGKLKENRKPD